MKLIFSSYIILFLTIPSISQMPNVDRDKDMKKIAADLNAALEVSDPPKIEHQLRQLFAYGTPSLSVRHDKLALFAFARERLKKTLGAFQPKERAVDAKPEEPDMAAARRKNTALLRLVETIDAEVKFYCAHAYANTESDLRQQANDLNGFPKAIELPLQIEKMRRRMVGHQQ